MRWRLHPFKSWAESLWFQRKQCRLFLCFLNLPLSGCNPTASSTVGTNTHSFSNPSACVWMCVSLDYAPHRTAHSWFLHSWGGWYHRVRVLKRLAAAYPAFPGFSLSIFNYDTPSVVPLTDWPRSSVSEALSMPLSQLDPGHMGQQIPTSWRIQNYVRLCFTL